MRVGVTEPVTYLTDQSRKDTCQTCQDMYLGRLVGPWSLVLSPGCCALWVFYRHCLQHLCVVRAKNEKARNPHIRT